MHQIATKFSEGMKPSTLSEKELKNMKSIMSKLYIELRNLENIELDLSDDLEAEPYEKNKPQIEADGQKEIRISKELIRNHYASLDAFVKLNPNSLKYAKEIFDRVKVKLGKEDI